MQDDDQQPNTQLPEAPTPDDQTGGLLADADPNADAGQFDAGEGDELPEEPGFKWQASEYVHNHKGTGWYAGLVGGVAILVGAALLLHYWLVAGAFVAMGVAIAVYAHKPPRVLTYELTAAGIVIEGHALPFKEFRSFGVLPDAEWHTIDLEPTRRFRPRMAVLFDPQDLDVIVAHLEQYLPRVDRQPDMIERVTQYLRF